MDAKLETMAKQLTYRPKTRTSGLLFSGQTVVIIVFRSIAPAKLHIGE